LRDLGQQVQDIVKVLSEASLTEKDLEALEAELKATNEAISQLNEKKMLKNS
jgi:hypothetical protein